MQLDGFDETINEATSTPTPIARRRGFAQALANHAAIASGGRDINFSRKRYPPGPSNESENNSTPVDSKRHKSANHPAASTNSEDVLPKSVTESDTPSQSRPSSLADRPSKFQEASMHDRPSEKP